HCHRALVERQGCAIRLVYPPRSTPQVLPDLLCGQSDAESLVTVRKDSGLRPCGWTRETCFLGRGRSRPTRTAMELDQLLDQRQADTRPFLRAAVASRQTSSALFASAVLVPRSLRV